tara:strand:+ start:420 stop:704 length:285 start_codon:yes stop_codon:yes gene_type:complete
MAKASENSNDYDRAITADDIKAAKDFTKVARPVQPHPMHLRSMFIWEQKVALYDYLVKALEGDAEQGISPVKEGDHNPEFLKKLHGGIVLPPIV